MSNNGDHKKDQGTMPSNLLTRRINVYVNIATGHASNALEPEDFFIDDDRLMTQQAFIAQTNLVSVPKSNEDFAAAAITAYHNAMRATLVSMLSELPEGTLQEEVDQALTFLASILVPIED